MRVEISDKESSYIYDHICDLESEISQVISEIDDDSSTFPNPIFYKKTKSIGQELCDMEKSDLQVGDISDMGKINNVYRSVIGYPERWTIPRDFRIFEQKNE